MVLVTVAYVATATGLVPAATFMPPWVTPPIIGGFLATKSIAGGVLAAVNLLISILIYMPFVKVATDQYLNKKQPQKQLSKNRRIESSGLLRRVQSFLMIKS